MRAWDGARWNGRIEEGSLGKVRVRDVVVGVTAVLITASASWATMRLLSAPEGNAIHACRGKENGLLRVVDSPAECHKNEKAITWNVQGPAGRPGQEGPPGEQGQIG